MLDSPKHELFCQLVARGTLLPWAYRGAGYMENPEAAQALAKRLSIRERIAELWPEFERSRNFVETVVTDHDEWEE